MPILHRVTPEHRIALNMLMVRLADGDRSAFQPVFDLVWPLVNAFSTRWTQGSPEAEDISQQVLLSVFSRASEFDRDRDAVAWILGIAAYECRTHRQKVRRRREEIGGDLEQSERWEPGSDPETKALEADLRESVLATLGRLAPHEREAVESYLLETERPLGVAPATFRKRLERGIKSLKTLWSVHESPY